MISCGNCKGRHATVAEVRACCGAPAGSVLVDERRPEPGPGGASAPTQKQLDYLRILLDDRECSDRERSVWEDYLQNPTTSQTKYGVSTAIERLKGYPKRQKQSAGGIQITQDGMYRMDGAIFKVQVAVHGSGGLYAKRLVMGDPDWDVADGKATAKFEYAPGAVTRLRPEHRMSLEEAKEFGKLYGVCCVCGRTLTDEQSIADGIGPVCGSRV